MSDTLILGGTPVPELAETAVVFEDGPWRLVRQRCGRNNRIHYVLWRGREAAGYISRNRKRRLWMAHTRDRLLHRGNDLDQAIGALWAAREA